MINTSEIAKEYRLSHWAQIFQERVESGLSIKTFCKQIGISGNTYFYWQRRVREAACEQIAELNPAQKSLPAPVFAEVSVCEPPALPPMKSVSQLRIEVAGMQITADSGYPTESLAALLRELVKPC
jgi:transposase-like protein